MLKPLKNFTKSLISPLLDATGLYGRRIEGASRPAGSWTIMMYHRVIEDTARDPFQLGMCVMRDRFERQIRYLSSRFNILTVQDAMSRMARGEPLPPRALSITFDDGYLDTLTRALPVMQRYGAPFSVYVPTGGIAEGQWLWWDRVIAAMAGSRRSEIDLQEVGLTSESEHLPLQSINAASHVERVLNLLWALDGASCEYCVERIVRWLDPRPMPWLQAERLSVGQVQELHRQGVEVGAHSVNHPNLALAGAEAQGIEMRQGAATLESWVQQPIAGFAYPGGHCNESAREQARSAGFAYALSTLAGVNHADSLKPWELLRIGMPDAELPDFRRSVGGAMLRNMHGAHLRF